MGAFERLADLVAGFLRGHGAHFRLSAGAKAGLAERNHDVGARAIERLLIRIGRNERDPLGFLVDHVLDGVAAATAHADHLDAGIESARLILNHIERHSSLFP